jgi:hypothetical protein
MMWVMTLRKAEKVGGFFALAKGQKEKEWVVKSMSGQTPFAHFFALAKGQKEKEWVVKSLSGQTPFAHLGCSHRSGRDQPVVG